MDADTDACDSSSLASESSSGGGVGQDLFLKQIMMSETLRENNKYWCEECSRLNEAQRSVQFELLPKVNNENATRAQQCPIKMRL